MSYKIAGNDVHKKVLMVVVMDAHAPDCEPERQRFATMSSDLRRLSSWLREHEVKEAVMESTALYWRSVWLEVSPSAARKVVLAPPGSAVSPVIARPAEQLTGLILDSRIKSSAIAKLHREAERCSVCGEVVNAGFP